MNITDDFVFLHFPKTGSTFVRKVFNDLIKDSGDSSPSVKIHKAPNIRALGRSIKQSNDEHGLRIQIPDEDLHKPIYSVRRNIFRQVVSLYEYGHWQISHEHLKSSIIKHYPNYPQLSFEEFITMRSEFSVFKSHPWISAYPQAFGPSSIMFILFYAKQPFSLLSNWNAEALATFKDDISSINFLQTSSLNDKLMELLTQYGYNPKVIKSIKQRSKVNQSKPEDKTYASYYTASMIELVKKTEPLFFDLFEFEEQNL